MFIRHNLIFFIHPKRPMLNHLTVDVIHSLVWLCETCERVEKKTPKENDYFDFYVLTLTMADDENEEETKKVG